MHYCFYLILHNNVIIRPGSTLPFSVGVMFDGSEAAGTGAELGSDSSVAGDNDRGDVGFSIAYSQTPC